MGVGKKFLTHDVCNQILLPTTAGRLNDQCQTDAIARARLVHCGWDEAVVVVVQVRSQSFLCSTVGSTAEVPCFVSRCCLAT